MLLISPLFPITSPAHTPVTQSAVNALDTPSAPRPGPDQADTRHREECEVGGLCHYVDSRIAGQLFRIGG